MTSLRACATLLALVLAACGSSIPRSGPTPESPAPTDPRGGGGEEERNVERERYIERWLKAAPEVD
jgi:hypothetical protein